MSKDEKPKPKAHPWRRYAKTVDELAKIEEARVAAKGKRI